MVDKNTELNSTEVFRNKSIAERFIKKGYNTVGAVIDLGLLGYLSEGFCMAEIFGIKKLLFKLGYGFVGDEYVIDSYENNDILFIYYNIDRLSALRNSIRGKKGFLAEEFLLVQKMMENLEQVLVLKSQKNSLKK